MASQPKTVLITDCSRGGIGEALAIEFHDRGFVVVGTAYDFLEIDHLTSLGTRIHITQVDVRDERSVDTAFSWVQGVTQGKLDVLVNTSASTYEMSFLDTDIAVAKNMFEVNFFGTLAMTKAFSSLLKDSRGAIVNIGSEAGNHGIPCTDCYSTSKTAVSSLTAKLRKELSPFGVSVIGVSTGGVGTTSLQNASFTDLPTPSRDPPAKETLKRMVNGTRTVNAWNIDRYAKVVVENVCRRKPKMNLLAGSSTLKAEACLWKLGSRLKNSLKNMKAQPSQPAPPAPPVAADNDGEAAEDVQARTQPAPIAERVWLPTVPETSEDGGEAQSAAQSMVSSKQIENEEASEDVEDVRAANKAGDDAERQVSAPAQTRISPEMGVAAALACAGSIMAAPGAHEAIAAAQPEEGMATKR